MLFKLTIGVVIAAGVFVIALILRALLGLMPEEGSRKLGLVIKILVGIIILWLLLLGVALRSPGGL